MRDRANGNRGVTPSVLASSPCGSLNQHRAQTQCLSPRPPAALPPKRGRLRAEASPQTTLARQGIGTGKTGRREQGVMRWGARGSSATTSTGNGYWRCERAFGRANRPPPLSLSPHVCVGPTRPKAHHPRSGGMFAFGARCASHPPSRSGKGVRRATDPGNRG